MTGPERPADDDSAAGVDDLVASLISGIGPRIGAPAITAATWYWSPARGWPE